MTSLETVEDLESWLTFCNERSLAEASTKMIDVSTPILVMETFFSKLYMPIDTNFMLLRRRPRKIAIRQY
jgi:hypothetical protein